jgi:signal transduction histidine kinase
MSGPHTLILVHSPQVQESLVALAGSLPWVPSRRLRFEPLAGDVQQGTSERRAREGTLPIGVVARDEPSALAALAGGADEATVFASIDAAALANFVDRIELRACLRAEGQRLHETFAHAEKLTALGTLVAGIGHEINNPLAAMLLSIHAARRYVLPGRDATQFFDDIGAAADSIASIVRDLRVFARTDQEEPPELVSVEELVNHALRLVGRELFHHALLERDYEPELPSLVVPRNRVTQVIINLLINAAHAIRDVERPNHRVRISARADEEFVAIAITDTGPGIAADSLGRIFDPFYTTKRQEQGTGLGLAISRSILRRLGGDLSVESVYGDGATFLCFLPIPTPEAATTACRRKDPAARRDSGRRVANRSVLVVDDDERVLRSYMRLLNPDHRLLIAQDASDAIELLESGSAPDAVLLELDLPGLDGRELLAWLADHRPSLLHRALIVTAVGTQPEYESFLRSYPGPVLHKPVRGEQLLAEITRVLA